jgi:predicted amidohydrolase
MSSPFTAAVVQSSPVVFEPKATLAKIRELTANAAKGGAKLVVFPEAFVSDDPKTVIMRGGSAIINSMGQVLAGPLFNEDGILLAELDPATSRVGSTTSTWSATTRAPTCFAFM